MAGAVTSRPDRLARVSTTTPTRRRTGWWHRLDTAAGGLALDLGLYAVSAAFAAITAATSTLLPHRAWGGVAAFGYLAAAIMALGQLILRRHRPGSALTGVPARWLVTVLTWTTVALLPLVVQSVQRAAGRTDRAQEEVLVVEESGRRLVETGTPYLGPDAIAALPPGEQLLGYTPYQPGMALFGLARAASDAWWSDARVWFAVGTALALLLAVRVLRRPEGMATVGHAAAVLRGVQAATVLPICALTLATGGDDLPVLALCLLALALAATARPGWAGVAVASPVRSNSSPGRSPRPGQPACASPPAHWAYPPPRCCPPCWWTHTPWWRTCCGSPSGTVWSPARHSHRSPVT